MGFFNLAVFAMLVGGVNEEELCRGGGGGGGGECELR